MILKNFVGSGNVEGNDYVAPNPKCKDGKLGLFKTDISNGKFHDFATNESGRSVIDLTAFVYICNLVDATQRLQQFFSSLASTPIAIEIVQTKKKKINSR